MPNAGEVIKSSSGDNATQKSITDFTQKVYEWQTTSSKKRKVADTSPTANTQPTKLKNRFQNLTDESSETNQTQKMIKPPPIFLQGIIDYSGMINKLAEFIDVNKIATKTLSNDTVKIMVEAPEIFRKLVKDLRTNDITFYTYQLKSERAFKVVIRNLHYSTNVDEIKNALKDAGHEVRNVINIRHWRTKEPLPLFYIDLEPRENNKSIYEMKTLLHTVIKVEAPRPRHEVVQCKRCQRYGHTKTYCTLPAVCVKCGGEHDNRACKKEHNSPPKCGLCGGEHTANYKGCPEYKLLTKNRSTVAPTPHIPPAKRSTNTLDKLVQPNRTYADVAITHTVPQRLDDNNDRVTRIEKIIEQLTQKFDDIIQQMKQILTVLVNITNKKP